MSRLARIAAWNRLGGRLANGKLADDKLANGGFATPARRAQRALQRPPRPTRSLAGGRQATDAGFTLIEVMIALAVVSIAVVALMGLHHQSMLSILHQNEQTKAALLAQELMTRAELEQFPQLGVTSGNFEDIFPQAFRDFRWKRSVEPSAVFPDIRMVRVTVYYGPRFRHSFELLELLHSPVPVQIQSSGTTPLGSSPPLGSGAVP